MKGRITKTGYRRNSPDVNNDFNIIPSNRISMRGVDFPVFGVDNMGNSQMMYPGGEYEFQGDYVTELPAYGSGGLTQWFAEKWVDIKTGKECGRSGKDKKGRPYPACRPSKRVNSTTPKTSSEMSASEKAKFKRKKKSGKRIDYNHKRAQLGGGLDPEMLYRDRYNTELTASEKKEFDKWVAKESKRQGRDILMDMGAYDVQGFWKSGDHKRMDQDNHGTDTWKKPNHPTFSNQSKYHGVDGFYGGNWKKDGAYQPSKQTLEMYGSDYYDWMFGLEPNRPEHLDVSRYNSGANKPTPFYYQRGGDVFQEVDTYIKPGQNIRPNWAQTPDAVTNYTFGKNLVNDESRFSLGLQGVDILDEIQYRADALGSVGVGVGNRNGKAFRPAGENLRAGIRGQASWQGVPGNVIENMFGRRSGLDWRGSVEGEAGLAYANGAVRPYLSFMPQTNIGIGGNMSIGIGAEMRGRYDNKGSLTQKDAYSGMSRGSGRYSLKYDMGDGDFIEGYYAPSDPLFQGETLGVRNVFALESKQPRFGIRLRKSFAKGGSLPTYQTQGQTSEDQSGVLIPEELEEVTVTGDAVKRRGPHGNAFGQFEGYVSPVSGESENLNIPFDFSGLSYKVKGDDHLRIRKPGKLARQIVDRFETEYGYAPENLYDYALGAFTSGFRGTTQGKEEYGLKPTLKERLFANKKGYNAIWAKDYDFPVSKAGFSNSYYYNPGDSDFNLSYLDLERGNLDEEWGQEKIDFNDVSNMFKRWDPVYQPSLQLNIQGNWNDGPGKSKVTKADIELFNPDYEVATPFVSNLFDYIGSDTYFERVAAGQYANEIDIDKWTTDASYRAGYANRLKSEKPEFLKNHYASLTDQFKDGIDVRDTRYSNGSLGSWASSSTSEVEGEGTKLYINPTLFSKGKTREEVTKEVTQALRNKNVSPYTAEYTYNGKMQPEEFDEALKNPNSALAQAQKMLIDAAIETGNFDWRNTIGHELGHSISMSRAKSLYRDGLAFDNNDPSAYTNDYELLYGMNNLTSGKDFYSLQDHVDAGLEPYTYLNTLDKKLDSQAADIGAEYHLISPEEIIGDIHGIRSYNQRVNKVNPKDQFTKENLETLLNDEKFKESLMYKRMQERYGDDQSKWMKAMNLIAVNEDKKSNTMYAQTGGQQGPPYMTEGPVQELVYPGRQEGPQDVLTENISRTGKLGNATKPAAPSVDVDRLRKGIKYAESLGGKLMMNPESSATGFYGQLFSEIEGKDFLQGISRQQFANDTTLQNKVFDERLAGNEGLFGKKTGLVQDGLDLYNEYKPQLGDKLTYTPTEIAALTNMLGRQGTREYLGYVLRDGKSLEEALPNLYGSSAKYKNKTPDQYIQKFNKAFGEGGENIPVYNTYSSKNRAWLAARKNLGRGKKFMYGGKVYSTNTPKGL